MFEEISKIAGIECTIDIDLERDHITILELLNPIEKENSISQLAPHLINEWDYQKNGDLLPNMVTVGSDKKVWWICPKGHSYSASASSRARGRDCPICNGKKVLKGVNDFPTHCPELLDRWNYDKNTLSPFEVVYGSDKKVWWICEEGHSYLRSVNNQRASQICPVCSNKQILVGFNDLRATHPLLAEEWDYDHNSLTPTEVTAGSHKKVLWKCRSCGNKWEAPVYNRTAGHGCPYCTGRKFTMRTNDLETENPQLAREWNYEKNNGLTPSDVSSKSGKKVWWKCKNGHEWQANIANRSNGRRCPYCVGKKVWVGYNDLETINPTLAKEWNYPRNGTLKPSNYTANSAVEVWWKCRKGHEWQARIDSRNRGNGCPYCAGRKKI